METERVETVKSALVHYSNTEKSILPQVNDLCDRMRTQLFCRDYIYHEHDWFLRNLNFFGSVIVVIIT